MTKPEKSDEQCLQGSNCFVFAQDKANQTPDQTTASGCDEIELDGGK